MTFIELPPLAVKKSFIAYLCSPILRENCTWVTLETTQLEMSYLEAPAEEAAPAEADATVEEAPAEEAAPAEADATKKEE